MVTTFLVYNLNALHTPAARYMENSIYVSVIILLGIIGNK